MIAHRLETAITYSDQILVMDKGTVVEYDNSFVLLEQNPEKYLEMKGEDVEEGYPLAPTRDTHFANMVRSLPV